VSADATGELTDVERQVALLVAWGGSNREIAEALGVDPKAVQRNLSRVYRKLGVHSRAELSVREVDDAGHQATGSFPITTKGGRS
jgi:DNA-binding NarL/FixJ family response regulator